MSVLTKAEQLSMGFTPRQKSKRKDKVKYEPCVQILVSELRIGDSIATTLIEGTKDDPWGVYAERSFKVEQIAEAGSRWRTHVNINRQYCYDTRCKVWVVRK